MPTVLFDDLSVQEKRRVIVRAALRTTITVAVVVAVYFLVPMDRAFGAATMAELVLAALVLVGVIAWQVRQIHRSEHPGARAVEAIATAFGVILVVPVAILALPTGANSAIAATAFVVALTQLKRYWLYYTLYTFALVLTLSTPGNGATEAVQRGAEVLAGIAILVLGLVIVHLLGVSLSKRYPQPELAGPTAP